MIIATTESIPGKKVKEYVGYTKGSVVWSKHIGKDIGASFKTLIGGEIKGYTEMQNEARQVAISRMVEEAEGMGADAIVGMRLASSAIMPGSSEIIAYGTAVKLENK